MQKIRIKKAPKPGDQQDYSLVGRNVSFTNSGEGTSNVKNTMGAVPVEEANIEVEGGETVVGDINKDGFLEQFTFVGKRHSQGGMPVNIPEGSFIFSDTKKLKIKDKELLESLFGLKEKKGGYTPAEIAKKYQINQFVQDLKSEDTDAIQKRSAAEMLKKNTQKLGMLALVQESMKGFPDGIPAIAESVMAGLQGAQIPGMEKGEGVAHEVMEDKENSNENEQSEGMEYGGAMRKYPDGGKVGEKFYIDGKEYKITKRYEGFWDTAGSGSDEWVTFDKPIKLSNGDTLTELPLKDYLQMQKNGKLNVGYNTGYAFVDPSYYTSIDNLGWNNQAVSLPGQGNKYYTINYSSTPQNSRQKLASATVDSTMPKIGDVYTVGNKKYKVTQNQLTDSDGAVVQVKQISDPDRNVGSYADTYAGYKVIPLATFKKDWMHQKPAAQATGNTEEAYGPYGNGITEKPKPSGTEYKIAGRDKYTYYKDANSSTGWTYIDTSGNKGDVTNSESVANLNKQVSGNKPAATTPRTSTQTQTQQPVKKAPVQNVNGKSDADIFKSFRYGGSTLNQYQDAGTVQGGPGGPQQTQPGTLNTTVATQQQAQAAGNQRVDPNKEIAVGTVTNDKGEVRYLFYKGATKIMKDANGTILMSGPRTDTQFEQYGSTNINKILAGSPNVLYTETNFGSFANQPNVKGTGIYLSSGNAAARQSGDLSPQEWSDFQRRHGDWIDTQYTGGFAQFQKDLKAGKASGDKATGWFQDAINEKSMKQFGVPYFTALGQGKKEDNPYYRDSKFGQVTYSVPRFFDAPKPPEQPGEELAYFCVEYTDGTKNVVSVSHKTGEQPVAPSGSNIKAVGAASKDKGVVDGQCISTPTKTFEKQPKKEGPWWLQDIVNYVGTQTDQVNRYEPTQGKIDLVTPGYDLLDPTRKLAANQEQMARYQSQVENTADGNVGLATVLGATGEGFANAANVLDTTEAANIGIVNQAYNNNAQVQNQEIVGNETARQKYVEDMATMNQQYDNALQQKKWREIAAFNNGTTNWFRKKQMENVLFPQVYIDPILGDVDFSGQGRQMFGDEGTGMAPDVYQNPYGAGRGGVGTGYNPAAMTQTANAAWKQAYDEAVGTRGEESARKYADQVANMYLQTAKQTPTWQNNFQQAYMSGMTMPSTFNATPWEDQ
jgi:hypothetical protein